MTTKVWFDGRVMEQGEARVPVDDHGLLYGDGVFEGMRVIGGRVAALERHLARLSIGARVIALQLPGGVEGIRAIVQETLAARGPLDGYVRLVVTRGSGPLGVDPTTCDTPRVICIATNLKLYSEEMLARGLSMITASVRRPPPDVLDPRVKSLNYLNNAMAKLEARRQGADEALLLNTAGRVAEAAVANVFVVRNGMLHTPPGAEGALEGINRGVVLEVAAKLGIAAHQVPLSRYDILAADEVFLTGSGAGLVPVTALDGRVIGKGSPGPMFERVRGAWWEQLRSLAAG